jgi:hypothetical protein
MKPLEASTGERSTRGRRKGDNPAQKGGTGGTRRKKPIHSHVTRSRNRPRYTPRREPETPRGYGRREEYEGERGPRGRGREKCQFADVPKV